MSVFKRGGVWWFEFMFEGQRVRESAKTKSKTLARDAERARRRQLELAVNGLVKRERPPLFPVAAEQWLDSKTALSPLGKAYYRQYVKKLKRRFRSRLVSDISADDIAALQRKGQAKGLSGRQVNCEVATLRAILRHWGIWPYISARVRMLPEKANAGRALSPGEERKLMDAVAASPSPSLYHFFVLSLDAGLRPSEIRSLRRRDFKLKWHNEAIVEGEIVVARSKTEAGAGRVVPLTRRVCGALTLWLSRFPDAEPDSYVFPLHHVGLAGNKRVPHLWGVKLDRPMSTYSYKTAWNTAREAASVDCRFYDLRHTFVTRLAENPKISEETIRQLAGHVSPKMLARYAHIRAQARRDAIATLERSDEATTDGSDFAADSPQKSPQSGNGAQPLPN